MISLVLLALAAIFNAVMDRVENEGFYQSVFKNLNTKFWYKRVTPGFAPMVLGWRFDAWHSAKSIMIVLITCAIVLYRPFIHLPVCHLLNQVAEVAIYGTAWNTVFTLFFGHLLKKK